MGTSAVTIVLDPDNFALVIRRSQTDPWKPGHWNFPGGKVDPNEVAIDAAVREVREEAGFRLSKQRVHHAFSYKHPKGKTHIFWARVHRRPKVRFPDGEHDASAWRKLDQLPAPAIPHLDYVAGRIAQLCLVDPLESGHTSEHGDLMSQFPQHYPGYLPYPQAIGRNSGPVPNESSVHWPQAQFAPDWLPPGSASFQPYSYLLADTQQPVPLYKEKVEMVPARLPPPNDWLHVDHSSALIPEEDDCGCGCNGAGDCAKGNPGPLKNPIMFGALVLGGFVLAKALFHK